MKDTVNLFGATEFSQLRTQSLCISEGQVDTKWLVSFKHKMARQYIVTNFRFVLLSY